MALIKGMLLTNTEAQTAIQRHQAGFWMSGPERLEHQVMVHDR